MNGTQGAGREATVSVAVIFHRLEHSVSVSRSGTLGHSAPLFRGKTVGLEIRSML